jgi:hypothetical protein
VSPRAGWRRGSGAVCNENLDAELVLSPKYNITVQGCTDLITGETLDPKPIVVTPLDCRLLQCTVAPYHLMDRAGH